MSDLSPDELDYLVHLWPQSDLTLGQIVARMETRFAAKYSEEQLRDEATRNNLVLVPVPASERPQVTWRPKATVWKPGQSRDTQCLYPVKPGTHRYEGGYRMGQRHG
jgi:hypothetical protein